MASNLLTHRRSISDGPEALLKRKKRAESEAALLLALLIGACAAIGIIFLANSEQSEIAVVGAPTAQIDSQR